MKNKQNKTKKTKKKKYSHWLMFIRDSLLLNNI